MNIWFPFFISAATVIFLHWISGVDGEDSNRKFETGLNNLYLEKEPRQSYDADHERKHRSPENDTSGKLSKMTLGSKNFKIINSQKLIRAKRSQRNKRNMNLNGKRHKRKPFHQIVKKRQFLKKKLKKILAKLSKVKKLSVKNNHDGAHKSKARNFTNKKGKDSTRKTKIVKIKSKRVSLSKSVKPSKTQKKDLRKFTNQKSSKKSNVVIMKLKKPFLKQKNTNKTSSHSKGRKVSKASITKIKQIIKKLDKSNLNRSEVSPATTKENAEDIPKVIEKLSNSKNVILNGQPVNGSTKGEKTKTIELVLNKTGKLDDKGNMSAVSPQPQVRNSASMNNKVVVLGKILKSHNKTINGSPHNGLKPEKVKGQTMKNHDRKSKSHYGRKLKIPKKKSKIVKKLKLTVNVQKKTKPLHGKRLTSQKQKISKSDDKMLKRLKVQGRLSKNNHTKRLNKERLRPMSKSLFGKKLKSHSGKEKAKYVKISKTYTKKSVSNQGSKVKSHGRKSKTHNPSNLKSHGRKSETQKSGKVKSHGQKLKAQNINKLNNRSCQTKTRNKLERHGRKSKTHKSKLKSHGGMSKSRKKSHLKSHGRKSKFHKRNNLKSQGRKSKSHNKNYLKSQGPKSKSNNKRYLKNHRQASKSNMKSNLISHGRKYNSHTKSDLKKHGRKPKSNNKSNLKSFGGKSKINKKRNLKIQGRKSKTNNKRNLNRHGRKSKSHNKSNLKSHGRESKSNNRNSLKNHGLKSKSYNKRNLKNQGRKSKSYFKSEMKSHGWKSKSLNKSNLKSHGEKLQSHSKSNLKSQAGKSKSHNKSNLKSFGGKSKSHNKSSLKSPGSQSRTNHRRQLKSHRLKSSLNRSKFRYHNRKSTHRPSRIKSQGHKSNDHYRGEIKRRGRKLKSKNRSKMVSHGRKSSTLNSKKLKSYIRKLIQRRKHNKIFSRRQKHNSSNNKKHRGHNKVRTMISRNSYVVIGVSKPKNDKNDRAKQMKTLFKHQNTLGKGKIQRKVNLNLKHKQDKDNVKHSCITVGCKRDEIRNRKNWTIIQRRMKNILLSYWNSMFQKQYNVSSMRRNNLSDSSNNEGGTIPVVLTVKPQSTVQKLRTNQPTIKHIERINQNVINNKNFSTNAKNVTISNKTVNTTRNPGAWTNFKNVNVTVNTTRNPGVSAKLKNVNVTGDTGNITKPRAFMKFRDVNITGSISASKAARQNVENLPKLSRSHSKDVSKSGISDKTLLVGVLVGSAFSLFIFILCCLFYKALIFYRARQSKTLSGDTDSLKTSHMQIELTKKMPKKNGSNQYVVSILGKKDVELDSSSEEEEVFNRSIVDNTNNSHANSPSFRRTSTPISTPTKIKKAKKPLLQ